jgi:hypothetical protein
MFFAIPRGDETSRKTVRPRRAILRRDYLLERPIKPDPVDQLVARGGAAAKQLTLLSTIF